MQKEEQNQQQKNVSKTEEIVNRDKQRRRHVETIRNEVCALLIQLLSHL